MFVIFLMEVLVQNIFIKLSWFSLKYALWFAHERQTESELLVHFFQCPQQRLKQK